MCSSPVVCLSVSGASVSAPLQSVLGALPRESYHIGPAADFRAIRVRQGQKIPLFTFLGQNLGGWEVGTQKTQTIEGCVPEPFPHYWNIYVFE